MTRRPRKLTVEETSALRGPDALRSSERVIALAAIAVAAGSLSAQRRFDPLPNRALPSFAVGTRAVVTGDFDGDGDQDLVVAPGGNLASPQPLVLLRNDGFFDFVDQSIAGSVGGTPTTIDLEGDGDLDLIEVGFFGGIRVFRNDGVGGFSLATGTGLSVTTNFPTGTEVVDVDSDGDSDLIFASSQTGSPSRLWLNDGTGVFTDVTGTSFVTSGRVEGVTSGDIDNDGDVDVILGTQPGSSGFATIMENVGGGGFNERTAGSVFLSTSFALGDIDGDGDLDLAGAARLSPPLSGLRVDFHLNDGAGNFGSAISVPTSIVASPRAIRFGDIDSDGDLDLAVAASGYGNPYAGSPLVPNVSRVLVNDGSGNFSGGSTAGAPEASLGTELFDVDSDGDLDWVLVDGESGGGPRILLNDGTGAMTEPGALISLPRSETIAVGDFDADGVPELLFGIAGQLRLLRSTLGDDFAEVSGALPVLGSQIAQVPVGDFDGDGDLDFLARAGGLVFVENQGGLSFAIAPGRFPAGLNPALFVDSADFDGDGDLDVISARGTFSPPSVLQNDGTGTFTDLGARGLNGLNIGRGVVPGDVDGDGDIDVVAFRYGYLPGRGYPSIDVYLNDGTATFTLGAMDLSTPQRDDVTDVALGDIDGDGDLDIVAANNGRSIYVGYGSISPARPNLLFLNDGAGNFTDASARLSGPLRYSTTVELGDVDQDGDLDIVFGNGGTVPIYPVPSQPQADVLWINDGSASTFSREDLTDEPLVMTESQLLTDLDRDGDPDLLTAAPDGGRIEWNLRRHVDVVKVVAPGAPYWTDTYSLSAPGAFVAPLVAFGRGSATIPGLGFFGLDPLSTITLPTLQISPSDNRVRFRIDVPVLAGLVGVEISTQSVVLETSGSLRLTNRISRRF